MKTKEFNWLAHSPGSKASKAHLRRHRAELRARYGTDSDMEATKRWLADFQAAVAAMPKRA